MKALLITIGISVIVACFFLFDRQDPREIILGTWQEPNNNFEAVVDKEKVFVTLSPKRKYTFLYAINTEVDPIELTLWRENYPERVYSVDMEINSSEEIILKPNLKKHSQFQYFNGPTRFKWNKIIPADS